MINLLTIMLAAFTYSLTRKPSPSMLRIAVTRGVLYRASVLFAAHALTTAGFLFFWTRFTKIRTSPVQESLVFWVMWVQNMIQYDLLPVRLVPGLTAFLVLLATGDLVRLLLDPSS